MHDKVTHDQCDCSNSTLIVLCVISLINNECLCVSLFENKCMYVCYSSVKCKSNFIELFHKVNICFKYML